MHPRTKQTALELLTTGRLSKLDHAKIPCCERWLERVLRRLYLSKVTRVVRWARSQGGSTPIYILADGMPDAPRPPPLTPQQKGRIRRAQRDVREREAALKRNSRMLSKVRDLSLVGQLGALK